MRRVGYRTKSEPICVIITEHDADDPFLSSGAIIMEQYPSDSPEQVMARAKSFAKTGKYGRAWVGFVQGIKEVLPPPDETLK